MTRLVLWDIDLTLVDARGFGARWYRKALADVTGKTLRRMPDTAGRTELAITTEVLEIHDSTPDEPTIAAMFAALTSAVAETRDELSQRGSALPGAARALTALTAAPGFTQTLVTGNLAEVAFHKLESFDLHHHIDFEIGGFGAASVHRHDLIADSVAKTTDRHGTTISPDSVVVIGDTPHDIAGALRFGAVAVGVATGSNSEDDLRAAGAHAVLPNLADTDAVLTALS
ncbi:HAD family hydrolase [Saccharopolyspora phatthalungensis]|uniref:Phosphoglycolate phosphatase-like HAD superfamily hydrolase n=1 Tax=Saccharopolyspora phatthalungensis TaxID=664693 RepID=A0A840QB20_9PSEU|nr:haloacid dehalogenase-like hydrolase [Saccharopolyspora phatthalungensis]MBB5155635.1 phosphoglycolate phosphatase-like HAD superfamily hydrolase [Saccharopolyspora phatthalungensis]